MHATFWSKTSLAVLMTLCSLASAATATDFTPSWNQQLTIFHKPGASTFWVKSKDARKLYCSVAARRNALPDQLKLAIQDGRINVDATKALVKQPFDIKTGFVDVAFRIPLQNITWDGTTIFTLEVRGKPGTTAYIGLNGETKEKKHYWNNRPFLLHGQQETLVYRQKLPDNLKHVHLIVRMVRPAAFSFGKATLSPKPDVTVDADKNWIVNGGAERGWYSSGVGNMLNRTAGKEYSPFWMVNTYRYPLIAELDNKEKFSGNASFKFVVRHDKPILGSDSHCIMHFNQVPVVLGKPAVFSLWMKSDRPNAKAMVRLHYAPGGPFYGLNATVGTTWKRYCIQIPSMGGKPTAGWLTGNLGNTGYPLLTPRIEFHTPGTFWLDNASFQYSLKGEYREEPINVTGTLNKDETYYFADETISTKLDIRATDTALKAVKLEWDLLDFFGHKVLSGKPQLVSLKQGQAETTLTLNPPPHLRGALNWAIRVNGQLHNYYLGIIDRPQAGCPRLGVNLGPVNLNLAVQYLKDFRYSAVRIWDFLGRVPCKDYVKPMHQAGFYVLYCLSKVHPEHTRRHLFPRDWTGWRKHCQETAEELKGMVDLYEVFNEPNARAGMAPNPDPEHYEHISPTNNVRLIQETAEGIRTADPTAKIAGPTTCKTDVAWTCEVLTKGGLNYLDVITEHPYTALPELPDYAQMLRIMRKTARLNGKELPTQATERGIMIPANTRDNQFDETCRQNTARLIRTMLVGYAGGSEKFYDFQFSTYSYAIQFIMLFSGNPDNAYLPKPGYGMYAARALADRLENAPMVRQVKMGIGCRCYIFDHGHKRTAAFWKWSGKPQIITFQRPFDIYDFMGTRTKGKSWNMNEFPAYLETELSVDDLEKAFANAQVDSDTATFKTSLNVRNSRSFAIRITNQTGKTLPQGTLEILSENATTTSLETIPEIRPEETTEVTFNATTPIQRKPRTLTFKAYGKKQTLMLKGITATHFKNSPVLDGKLDEWSNIKPIVLTGDQDAEEYTPWTPDQKNIRAELRFAWNTRGFYMAVTVHKKDFHPVEANGIFSTWQGDGLQIGMDTLKNATPGASYMDDDFEYAISLFRQKPTAVRHKASLAIHDSLAKNIGVAKDVTCAIREEPGKVTYEVAFLPFAVSPFRLAPGESMRVSVIVNANDGQKRIGYLMLTPGLGDPNKRPVDFIDLFLEQ